MSTHIDTAEWMKHIPSNIKTIPFNQITLPGTHNSGAYNINLSMCVDYPSPYKYLRWIPFSHKIIIAWAKTQESSIYEQLIRGIRVFDFRLAYHNDTFYIAHTYICVPLKDVIDDINKFLAENTSEILVLSWKTDFNLRHTINHEQIYEFFNILDDELGGWNIPGERQIRSYNDLIKKGNIINFYDSDFHDVARPLYIFPNGLKKGTGRIDTRDPKKKQQVILERVDERFVYTAAKYNKISMLITPNDDDVKKSVRDWMLAPWGEPRGVREFGEAMQYNFDDFVNNLDDNTNTISSISFDYPYDSSIKNVIGMNF